jgi:uncharacterized protein
VVRVTERAFGGRATDAALRAVATAVGVPGRSVTPVTGATSRRKRFEIATVPGEARQLEASLHWLLGGTNA